MYKRSISEEEVASSIKNQVDDLWSWHNKEDDDGVKVWLNGELVHQNNVERGFVADEDNFTIHLLKGENTLMMKITQGVGGWAASAVICDMMSVPLEGLEFRAE